jgi:hypothetical protein
MNGRVCLMVKLYVDDQMSRPSAYSLAEEAPKRDRRCRLAVGVETATLTAALSVHQAVGVAPGMRAPYAEGSWPSAYRSIPVVRDRRE